MIVGLDSLIHKLDRLANIDVKNQLSQSADNIVDTAKSLAPVDTGFLRDSIHKEETIDGVNVVADADYAEFVEFGTWKTRPQPFMYPAVEQERKEIVKQIAEEVRRIL